MSVYVPGRPEGLLKGPFCKEQSRKKALGESGCKKRPQAIRVEPRPNRVIKPKLNSSNADERSVATMPNRSTKAKDQTYRIRLKITRALVCISEESRIS